MPVISYAHTHEYGPWCVTCALLSIGYVQLTVHVMTVKAPVELCVTIKIVTCKLLEFVSYYNLSKMFILSCWLATYVDRRHSWPKEVILCGP